MPFINSARLARIKTALATSGWEDYPALGEVKYYGTSDQHAWPLERKVMRLESTIASMHGVHSKELTNADLAGYKRGLEEGKRAPRYATGGYTGIINSEDLSARFRDDLEAFNHSTIKLTPPPPKPTHLDALDLVIEAFGLKEYGSHATGGTPKRGAQRLYDDLIAAKEFRTKHDAFHRIEEASTLKGFDAGVEAAFETIAEDSENEAAK